MISDVVIKIQTGKYHQINLSMHNKVLGSITFDLTISNHLWILRSGFTSANYFRQVTSLTI